MFIIYPKSLMVPVSDSKAPGDFQLENCKLQVKEASFSLHPGPSPWADTAGHLTSVIEHGVDERAVAEERVAGRDVFEVTLLK